MSTTITNEATNRSKRGSHGLRWGYPACSDGALPTFMARFHNVRVLPHWNRDTLISSMLQPSRHCTLHPSLRSVRSNDGPDGRTFKGFDALTWGVGAYFSRDSLLPQLVKSIHPRYHASSSFFSRVLQSITVGHEVRIMSTACGWFELLHADAHAGSN